MRACMCVESQDQDVECAKVGGAPSLGVPRQISLIGKKILHAFDFFSSVFYPILVKVSRRG